jgi:hypothetical protein
MRCLRHIILFSNTAAAHRNSQPRAIPAGASGTPQVYHVIELRPNHDRRYE